MKPTANESRAEGLPFLRQNSQMGSISRAGYGSSLVESGSTEVKHLGMYFM